MIFQIAPRHEKSGRLSVVGIIRRIPGDGQILPGFISPLVPQSSQAVEMLAIRNCGAGQNPAGGCLLLFCHWASVGMLSMIPYSAFQPIDCAWI
jgi:hypothetical protein